MSQVSRRRFLGMSLAGLGTAAWAWPLSDTKSFAAEAGDANAGKFDSLFLTWRQDPTTTLMIQWVAACLSTDACDSIPSVWMAKSGSPRRRPQSRFRERTSRFIAVRSPGWIPERNMYFRSVPLHPNIVSAPCPPRRRTSLPSSPEAMPGPEPRRSIPTESPPARIPTSSSSPATSPTTTADLPRPF